MVRLPNLIQKPDKTAGMLKTKRSKEPPLIKLNVRVLRNTSAKRETRKEIQEVRTRRLATTF